MGIDSSIYGQQSPDLLGNFQKGLSISNSMKDQKRQDQQALAQQQEAQQKALAEQKQKEVQLLARSGRGVKDQAGYDTLLKTAKFMGHDITQLPPQWGADAQGMIASLASNELGVDKQIGIETDAKQFDYTKNKDDRSFGMDKQKFGLDQQKFGLDKTKANRDYATKLAEMGLTTEQFEETKNQNAVKNTLAGRELDLLNREKTAKEKLLESNLAKKSAEKMSPGQAKMDTEFAKDYDQWTSGGAKNARLEIDKLKGVLGNLSNNSVTTGGLTGMFPDRMTSSNLLKTRADVQSSIMTSLRELLGPAFTEKEGQRVITNTWNEADTTENNITRVQRLVQSLENQANDKDQKAQYFSAKGSTLAGYGAQSPQQQTSGQQQAIPDSNALNQLPDDELMKMYKQMGGQ